MTPTSATTSCLGTPPRRSAAARWGPAGGTTARFTPVPSLEEVPGGSLTAHQKRRQIIQWHIDNKLLFCFIDDYNKLCPHGSGLLPLPASSMADQRPFIGNRLPTVSNLCSFLFFILVWMRCQSLTLPIFRCKRVRDVRIGDLQERPVF